MASASGPGGTLARLDDIDRKVIAALQADGRRPFSRIASELGIAESVVRYRVQRLERDGILQVVGIADPLRIGFDRMALLGVRVRPGTIASVCETITAFPETSYVAALAGVYDVVIEVVCRDTAHFAELLTERVHAVEGVVSVDSNLVLDIYKMAYGWGVPEVATSDPGADEAAPEAANEGAERVTRRVRTT